MKTTANSAMAFAMRRSGLAGSHPTSGMIGGSGSDMKFRFNCRRSGFSLWQFSRTIPFASVLGGILVEVGQTLFAAELEFLSGVGESERRSVAPQFFSSHNATIQWVGLDAAWLTFVLIGSRGEREGHENQCANH